MHATRTELLTPQDVATLLIDRFRRSGAFQRVDSCLRGSESNEKPVWVRGLAGSSRALLFAGLARDLARPVIVIVPDLAAAEDLKEDLAFLLGRGAAAVFPEPGLDPYHPRHPRISSRASRIELLAALADPVWRLVLPSCANLKVILVTSVALSSPVPRRQDFNRRVLPVNVGDRVDPDDLMNLLIAAGYESVHMVSEHGEVSRRGGILDVYTFGRTNPVRIEFDEDGITSLREFDPYSQRSTEPLHSAVLLPVWEWIVELGDVNRLRPNRPEEVAPDQWDSLLESLEADGTLEGIEWFLPRLGVERSKLADYIEAGAMVLVDGPTYVRTGQRGWEAELEQAFEARFGKLGDPVRPEHAPAIGQQIETSATRKDSSAVDHTVHLVEGSALHTMPFGLRPGAPQELFWFDDTLESLLPPGKRVHVGSGGTAIQLPETGVIKADFRGNASTTPPPLPPRGTKESRIEQRFDEMDGTEAGRFGFNTVPPETFGRDLEQTRTYVRGLFEKTPEIHILCDTENHRDRLAELLRQIPAMFHVGNLAGGFLMPDEGFAILTDHEIFSRARRRTAPRRFGRGLSIKELLALQIGDFVVHVEQGIGCYKGMNRLVVDGQETDCLTLEYSGGDVLYVPVHQLDKVQKYAGGDGARPSLSKLGGKSWARTKAKIKKSIKDMAEELIRTHSIRKARPGYAFSTDTDLMKELEASFPYDETTDQLAAIEDVKNDLESASPMDRLICGDVGYGKTEVAIRAAFKAAQDGKQVAMLVPTTLLARQHYESFKRRIGGLPLIVDFLSRFRSAAETKDVLQRTAEGKIDVLIGTHVLLGKAMKFKDLGLLVIDEEQLFGVKHKEALKKFRETVDVLTLTATPIPRTMHMALMGGRDMSLILTPPRDRLPIQTEVLEFRDDVIAHALMQEADRGGQSFFVHNRVETIDSMANHISGLVPHLRIAVAHGQMREHQLEEVMKGFLDGDYDVLVSTMIIESGLDLPNVNTIVINRGDTFGLAQLYQLRGRVGRSNRKAYAYLLLPPNRVVTEQAQKRLKAIEEFEDLGSGYQLALRDLEIRGAGDLLGSQQSGFIISVGFELYCQLLDEAVRELKGEVAEEKREPRMSTDLEAFLPDEYVPDPREKINLYKSLADARDLEAVEAIAIEMNDRFGKHPDAVQHLLGLRRIRLLAAKCDVGKVMVRHAVVQLDMDRDLKKKEIESILRSVPFQVEFELHGGHRMKVRQPKEEAISTALILLRAMDQAR